MIVYIDQDGVLCDFYGAHARDLRDNPAEEYPQSREGFYRELEPLPQALEAVQWMNAVGIDTYILTAPSVYNPHSYTEKRLWVEDHLGFEMCKRLILSPHKNLLDGHFLIDDNISGHGQDGFTGDLIHFGSKRFPDWSAVMLYLKGVMW